MRLIHTADWHLGKHIEGHSRLEEQELFLEDFVNIVKERDADVVLIAGDIYDSSNPPAKAEQNKQNQRNYPGRSGKKSRYSRKMFYGN